MKFTGRSFKRALSFTLGGIALLAVAYVVLVFLAVIPWPYACISETKMKLPNVSGGDFEIIYTNCDTLAKEESISVHVSRAGASRVTKWLNKKTLLFQYDPGAWDAPLPSIRASGQGRVLISIPRVSSISVQSRNWANVSVDYEIGHIDYPVTGQSQQTP